jgi:RNA ligase
MKKYPRTPHIEGSRQQPGDEDLDSVPFNLIANEYVVIEEKVDGANAAISFDAQGQLLLQSRGHYLTGGARERHFNLFKQWAHSHYAALWDVLGDRYILYGEWLYAKHTVFYDRLPHYFLEYDLRDRGVDRNENRASGQFLSTAARKKLLNGLALSSVPVLFEGKLQSHKQLVSLLQQSHFISTEHIDRLRELCIEQGLNADLAVRQTNQSSLMEGLYIKVETPELTIDRYKYVRADFLTTILQSETHWLNRPIIPNQLQAGVDLFGLD